jgi:predicted nucleotidyltransferase
VRVTGPGQPVHFLLDIADLLNELRIPYVVVGALAVSFYGIPRATNDADTLIWLRESDLTEKDLTNRLLRDEYRVERRIAELDDPVAGVVVVEEKHQNRVDLLLGIRGMDPGALARATAGEFLNSSLQFIGLEDLIAMKVFAGGVRDIEDVKGILQVSGTHLNVDLLRELASRYGAEVLGKLEEMLKMH